MLSLREVMIVLITKEMIFAVQILDSKDCFSTSLNHSFTCSTIFIDNQAFQYSPWHPKLHQLGLPVGAFLVYCNCEFYLPVEGVEGVEAVTVCFGLVLFFLLQLFLVTLCKSSAVLGLAFAPLLLPIHLRF